MSATDRPKFEHPIARYVPKAPNEPSIEHRYAVLGFNIVRHLLRSAVADNVPVEPDSDDYEINVPVKISSIDLDRQLIGVSLLEETIYQGPVQRPIG